MDGDGIFIGGGGGGGRRVTLADQMSAVDRSSLGEILQLKETVNCSLKDVLANDRPSPPPLQPCTPPRTGGQSLLEIIRDEELSRGGNSCAHLIGHRDKRTWRALREKFRLKRAGGAWISFVRFPASDIPIQSGRDQIPRRDDGFGPFVNSVDLTQPDDSSENGRTRFHSTVSDIENATTQNAVDQIPSTVPSVNAADLSHRVDSLGNGRTPVTASVSPIQINSEETSENRTAVVPADNFPISEEIVMENEGGSGSRPLSEALAEERELSAREVAAVEGLQPARMSLMALLEETEQGMGMGIPRYIMGEEEKKRCEGEEVEEGRVGTAEQICCVCMVRHKGAAFIPCGHTFCRMCSRELWVQRGNCPLCNNFILEILDIF